MTTKSPLMPAPRPRGMTSNLLSADAAKALLDANADLGFKRASTSPKEDTTEIGLPQAEAIATKKKASQTAPSEPAHSEQMLRFSVPDGVATALKIASVHRRASVRYLILEALQKAGYPVELENIPEDGRRQR